MTIHTPPKDAIIDLLNEAKKHPIPRKRIKAICRRGKKVTLPCNWINTKQLIEGTGICGADGQKCRIIREVR